MAGNRVAGAATVLVLERYVSYTLNYRAVRDRPSSAVHLTPGNVGNGAPHWVLDTDAEFE